MQSVCTWSVDEGERGRDGHGAETREETAPEEG